MPIDFKLPDLGENIDTAEVVSVMVNPGQTVSAEQPVVEVETDKAVMEVPIDTPGTVLEVKVAPGQTIHVGQVLLTVEPAAPDASAAPAQSSPADTAKAPSPAVQPDAPPPAESSVSSPAAAPDDTAPPPPPTPTGQAPPSPPSGRTPVPAAPSVRNFAREIGVNIADVAGSGPGGRISIDDVKRHARTFPAAAAGAPRPTAPLPDLAKYGPIERRPMSNLRKKAAAHLAHCWSAPHVTLHDQADVSTLESFRRQYKDRVEQAGGKLTVTALMVKIVAAALKKFPLLNSALDLQRQEIIVRKYIHVGVAADTPRGLVVPVILDADKKNITEVCVELTRLADKARAGKLALEEMAGGTFTVTNLGGIGIKHFTPIVNSPEVAILGLGRTCPTPALRDGRLVEIPMMPLSLSFDHRLVDGADGARFLRFIVQAIEQPLLIAME